MRPLHCALLAVVLALSAHPATGAQIPYTVQPIIALGERVGDVLIPRDYQIAIGGLNDKGQIIFGAGTIEGVKPELLLQYADNQITPIVVPGGDAPTGKWPSDVIVTWPLRMNQHGNVVFSTMRFQGGWPWLGTYTWDYSARKVTPVVLRGMPAGPHLTFTVPGGFTPAINNRDELALVATVRALAGPSGLGLFLRGQDAALSPILVPGEELPGGGKVRSNDHPVPFLSLNDAGAVAFLVQRQGQNQSGAYRWEQGSITPVVLIGAAAPGGGKISSVSQVLINTQNRRVLLAAAVGNSPNHGVYAWVEGELTPVAVPGQELPDGGKFRALQGMKLPHPEGQRNFGISAASEAGEHAFLARLQDGSTAAYRIAADGKLSLIVKSGMTTDRGQITNVGGAGFGIALNTQGQVALTMRIVGGRETVVLLTPTGP